MTRTTGTGDPGAPCAARSPAVYLETFGCQMNELDSELVRTQLAALGYRFTPVAHEADVVLYNTCSVRQQAENKVLSRLGLVALEKQDGRRVVVGVLGCMAEREGLEMLRRYPQVDFLCGPGELDKVPLLIDNALRTRAVELADRAALAGNRHRRSQTLSAATDNLELLDLARAFDPDGADPDRRRRAYVRITRGCNKFCTYCVVPFTRGAEVHRPPDAIVAECRHLADAGVIEVTLLGQTVNHYVYTHGAAVSADGTEAPQVGPGSARGRRLGRLTSFADLLQRIHEEVPAIRRLRFVTSFPRDFGDDILEVMAACPRICRYLHVPAQSGSDRILRLMNRGYTRQEYLAFLARARERLPDVCVAGDIIVGFPSETEADFAETCALIRLGRFKNSFIFKYSPRPGTLAAARLADDVPEAVKRRRNNEALAVQSEVSRQVHEAWVGRSVEVFMEKVTSRRTTGGAVQLSGRTGGDLIVVVDRPAGSGSGDLVGEIVPVEVTGAGPLLLRGRLASDVAPPQARSIALHVMSWS